MYIVYSIIYFRIQGWRQSRNAKYVYLVFNPLVTRKAFSDRFCSNFQGYFKADQLEFHFFNFFKIFIFLMILNFIKFLVNLMMYF